MYAMHAMHAMHACTQAPPNNGEGERKAVALTYFEKGAVVARDLIHYGPANGGPGGSVRGVELGAGGESVVFQLLGDDMSTWLPWAMEGLLVPGLPLNPMQDSARE